MTSTSSDSESSIDSDRNRSKEHSDYKREVELSSDDDLSEATYSSLRDSSDEDALCADDPVASEEWTACYEQEMRENTEEEGRMRDRLNGVVEIGEWWVLIYTIHHNFIHAIIICQLDTVST
jgi:hypothetical protein